MDNDVNKNQVVTGSGVVEAATTKDVSQKTVSDKSVNASDGSVSQKGDASAQGTKEVLNDGTQINKPVAYDRFKEVNEASKAKDATIAQLQQMVVQQQQGETKVKQPEQQSLTLQVMKEMNIDPESILTGAEQAQVNDEVILRINNANQSQMQAQNFVASKPDFVKVVGTLDPVTGQYNFASPMKRALEEDPSLIHALRGAGSGAGMLAYKIASKDPKYVEEVAKAKADAVQKNSEEAAQVIQQADNLTSVSAVSGTGTIDKAAAIRAMSDQEFAAYKDKIMQG